MAGPRSYKPQTGVRFPQLRQTPRAAVVRLSVRSEIAPLHGASPMGAPRAAHLRSWRLNFSPIEGREPAFEAGDAGSIPARGAVVVAVVYWSARLAVNEEVRVRSPPVTPQEVTGCGSMAGHLARNQVHAGSIPAAQTEAAHKRGRDAGLEMDQHQALWTTRKCRRPLKAQDRVRLPAGSQRPIGLRGDGCRTFNPENGVRLPDGTQTGTSSNGRTRRSHR
jgi:hypothetical protein